MSNALSEFKASRTRLDLANVTSDARSLSRLPQAGAGGIDQDASGRLLVGALCLHDTVDHTLIDEYGPALARLGT